TRAKPRSIRETTATWQLGPSSAVVERVRPSNGQREPFIAWIHFIARVRPDPHGDLLRPRLDRSRRTIARTLTTLIAILWASSVSAAPSGASPAAGTGTGTSATAVPLQRPAGMEPGPTTPPAKAPPPAEVGPQPQPPSLVEPSTP